jgi:peroxiredoxin
MRRDDLYTLPPGLPVPTDDGACRHLRGAAVPAISLPSTLGRLVRLDQVGTPWVVVYAYPRTGVPDVDTQPDWDAIPGARGCTPQSCAYRDREVELRSLGATVFGLSTQTTEYQQEMAARLQLPFEVLSDSELRLTRALRLPTFQYGDWTLLKRLTLIIAGDRIEEILYPVFPSDADAGNVVRWLQERAVS